MSKRLLPLVFLSIVFLVHGCAFGTRNVDLKYPPEKESEKGIAEAAPAKSAGTQIVLLPFEDKRLKKNSIGEVLNGFGMKTAKVVAKNDIGEWANSAIETELKNAGYQVSKAKTPEAADSNFVLSGEITKVFCTAYLSYEGEVTFFAKVEQGGKELLNKRYFGEGGAGVNWAATSGSYGETLSLALKSAIRELVYDLSHITEKKSKTN